VTISPPKQMLTSGLHLLTGPPNAGKSGFALAWWMALQQRQPLVVVPSLVDSEHILAELLERVPVILDGRPVSTFDGLVGLITPHGPRPLGDVQRELVISDILSREWGGPFNRVARLPGSRPAAGALLDELGESGRTPQEIRAALAGASKIGSTGLLADVLTLYDRYRAEVEARGHVDRHQALLAAAESIGDWDRPVAFHGFLSFTAAQRALIHALAEVVPVLVTLAVTPDRSGSDPVAQEAGLLERSARSVVRLPRQELAFSSPSIARLEGAFLTGETKPPVVAPPVGTPPIGEPDPTHPDPFIAPSPLPIGSVVPLEGVRFLRSAGRRLEAEAVASEVVRLLRSGVSPGDIAILVREVGPWRRILGEALTRFGVPHSMDTRVTLDATGLGHSLVRGLRGVARGDLDSLLAYLRTPYQPAALDEVDRAEAKMRRSGRRAPADLLADLESRLPGAMGRLRAAFVWGEAGPVGLSRDGLLRLAAGMVASSAVSREGAVASLEEDARVLRTLQRALEEWDLALSADEISADVRAAAPLAGSVEESLSVLASLSVASGTRGAAGAVTVSSVRRARARRFPVVFIMGLVDGEFPGGGSAPGILAPGARAQLRDSSDGPLVPEPVTTDDSHLFTLALSRPWQLLYLSARDAEDDGSEVLPSPYWTEARRLLGGEAQVSERRLGDVVFSADEAPTVREYLRACAVERATPPSGDERARLSGLPEWDCRPSRLSEPEVLGSLTARETFSATELEAYVGCPYRWFVDRVVGLNAMEESLSGMHAGSAAHRVLAELYGALLAEGHDHLTPDSLDEALKQLPAALEKAARESIDESQDPQGRLIMYEVEKRVRWMLEYDAAANSSLRVAELESSLPDGGVPFGDYFLTGRIDRLDEDPESGAAVIVDYKWGTGIPTRDFAGKGVLQVPLYVLALRAGASQREAAGGVYVALGARTVRGAVLDSVAQRGGDWFKGCAVDEDQMEVELEAVRAAAGRAVEGIRSGRIEGRPLRDCPAFCDLRSLCRTPARGSSW
jgi:RecB family exonuclease